MHPFPMFERAGTRKTHLIYPVITTLLSLHLLIGALAFTASPAIADNLSLKELGTKLKINSQQISVSGISSGAYMAMR